MGFVFGSVSVVNYVYRLAYVEPALHPQDEFYLIIVDKLFNVLLQLACQYFIEDFCIYVHHGYWPEYFFLIESLLGFGIKMILVSKNDLGRIPSFWIIWNSFRRNGNSSSLSVW